MKRLIALMMCAVSLGAAAQVDFPWNPDTNDDGIVGAEDLLAFLAVYNGEWELPDPTLWATSTITSLLELQAELDSIANAQQEMLAEIELGISELQQIGDSLQSNGNTCYAVQGTYNGSSYTNVPPTCRHVNVYTGYGNGSANPMRLPEQGLFVGHSISFFLLPYGNANRTVAIQPHPNDAISDGAALIPCNGSFCGGALSYNNTSVAGNSNHNKKFVWDGFRWELVSSGAITLSTSYN